MLELLQRQRLLLANLARKGFPIELPAAVAQATPPATAPPADGEAEEAERGGEASSDGPSDGASGPATRQSAPPQAPPPKEAPPPPREGWRTAAGAVCTVQLTEVEGAAAGGEVHVMAVGEAVEDSRWALARPGSGGEEQLKLRAGFRVRRSISRGRLGGRTFEMWLERLESADLALHGGPLWCARAPLPPCPLEPPRSARPPRWHRARSRRRPLPRGASGGGTSRPHTVRSLVVYTRACPFRRCRDI